MTMNLKQVENTPTLINRSRIPAYNIHNNVATLISRHELVKKSWNNHSQTLSDVLDAPCYISS